MDRRTFLTRTSAAMLGGLFLPRASSIAASRGERLRDLPEVRSTGGLLDAHVRLRDRALTLDTYNGELPGPILRVRPGDRMRVLLRNLMRPMGIPLNRLPPLCAAHPGDTTGTTNHPDAPSIACRP
jgi:FtsP/CotA-like multicopper oxidase with cupredoxin domain